MLRPPDRPRPPALPSAHAYPGRAARPFLIVALLACLTGAWARAGDSPSGPDILEEKTAKLSAIVEAGAAFGMGSDQGVEPQLGCYRDLPASWQIGLQARVSPAGASTGYDYLPQIGAEIRKLW